MVAVPGMSRYVPVCPSELFAPEVDRRVRAVYEAVGASEHYALDLFGGGHRYNVATALEWFNRWL